MFPLQLFFWLLNKDGLDFINRLVFFACGFDQLGKYALNQSLDLLLANNLGMDVVHVIDKDLVHYLICVEALAEVKTQRDFVNLLDLWLARQVVLETKFRGLELDSEVYRNNLKRFC